MKRDPLFQECLDEVPEEIKERVNIEVEFSNFLSLVAKMREAQKKTDDLYCDDEWWHKRAKQLESEVDEHLKKMEDLK